MSRISTNKYKRLLNRLNIKSTNAKNQSDKARLLLKEYPKENVKLKEGMYQEEITSYNYFWRILNNNFNYRYLLMNPTASYRNSWMKSIIRNKDTYNTVMSLLLCLHVHACLCHSVPCIFISYDRFHPWISVWLSNPLINILTIKRNVATSKCMPLEEATFLLILSRPYSSNCCYV